jgi:DNA-binding PadR family transcriptional regulator
MNRTLSLLEAFLLSILCQREEVTFYSLKRDFHLNPGGITHAFRDMKQDGLVSRSSKSGRARAFRVTTAGEQALCSQWRAIVADGFTDRDSAVRIAWLATTMDFGAAPEILRSVAHRTREEKHVRGSATNAGADASNAAFYFTIKDLVARHEALALASALEQIAELLEKVAEP